MTELEPARSNTRAELRAITMYMHARDVEAVSRQISEASTADDLRYISFSLRFHQFRIEAAKRRGELVEVSPPSA